LPDYNLSADPAYSVNSSKPAAPSLLLSNYPFDVTGMEVAGNSSNFVRGGCS